MSEAWRDLLESADPPSIVLPWVGGRVLRYGTRTWRIKGALPQSYDWYSWFITGRQATIEGHAHPDPDGVLDLRWSGYLVGDRFVPDIADDVSLCDAQRVHLIEMGHPRFTRVTVGTTHPGRPLVYIGPAFPLGPEPEVTAAYENREPNIDHIPNVTPALQAAFNLECHQRALTDQRRAEAEAAARRAELMRTLGDGAGRRTIATTDFVTAATAALAVGGATYLDHNPGPRRNEYVVRFRLRNRRFECTCDATTLRVIDSGVCLTAEYDSANWARGTRGDQWFTLESLPGVITQAINEGVLVVFRHVN